MNENQDLLRLSLQELVASDNGVRSLSVLVSRHVLRLYPLPIMLLADDFVDAEFEQDISMYVGVLNACFAYKELLDSNDTAAYQKIVGGLEPVRSFFRRRGERFSKSKKLVDRLLSPFFESLSILSGKVADAASIPALSDDTDKLIECALRCLASVTLPKVDIYPYMDSVNNQIQADFRVLISVGSNGLDYSPLWLTPDNYAEEIKSRFWGWIERLRDHSSPIVKSFAENIATIFSRLHSGHAGNISRKTIASDIFKAEKPSNLDTLNRSSLAIALARNLAHEKNSDSRTIGLLGDWGSGKTTFVDMLKRELVKYGSSQPFIFGEFNAWSYEHTDNIQAGVAQELIKALTSSPDFSNQPVISEKGGAIEGTVIPTLGVWSSIKSSLCAVGKFLFNDWSIVIDFVKKIPQLLQKLVCIIYKSIINILKIAIEYLRNIKTLLFILYLLFFSIPWTYSFLRSVLDLSIELPFSPSFKNLWIGCFLALGVCHVMATKDSLLKSWFNSGASNFFSWLKRLPVWSGLTLGWAFDRLKLTIGYSMRAHPFQLIKIIFLTLLAMAPWIFEFFKEETGAKLLWVIGFGAVWFREVSKIVMNPLAKELLTYLRLPSYAEHLGEIPVMRENINLLCKLRLKEKKGKTPRLLFVVDDLDRCSHSGIVKVFEAVRLVLDIENVIVIIAIDQHVALAALALHYSELSGHHKSQSSRVIARDYLAKVIHLPITLRKPSVDEVEVYLRKLWSIDSSVFAQQSDVFSEDIQRQDSSFESFYSTNSIRKSADVEASKEEDVHFAEDHKNAFIYWVNYFGISNSRQLKRLDNCYDLLRSYVSNVDIDSVEIKINTQTSKPAYPMMLTLILMEYLNSMDDAQVRECLWRDLFFTEEGYSWVVNDSINKDFIDSYRFHRSSMATLADQVESFVLPAVG